MPLLKDFNLQFKFDGIFPKILTEWSLQNLTPQKTAMACTNDKSDGQFIFIYQWNNEIAIKILIVRKVTLVK